MTRKALVAGLIILVLAWLGYQYRVYLWAAVNQPQMFLPPSIDDQAPALPADLGAVPILSFSKTNGFRHHDAIAALRILHDDLASANGWQFFHTENGACFTTENLARFDLVVLSHKSGRTWNDEQQAALRAYVEAGGTLIAHHAAGDASNLDWTWYGQDVIRARFTGHPMTKHIQPATLQVEDPGHPATAHLAATWRRADEWYSFAASPRALTNVLISIDEKSYDPEAGAMGADHPLVWWHRVGAGRVLFNAMGHTASSYDEEQYKAYIEGLIQWGLAG